MPIRNEADTSPQRWPRSLAGVPGASSGSSSASGRPTTAPSGRRRAGSLGDDLVVVDNPSGVTPSALNAAIRAGSAPVVVRVDGHSELSEGYIRGRRDDARTGAVNVGGLQVPVATTPFEEAVAAATTSWLGTGGASYRVGGEEGPVDTVYLGVFDRAAIEAVGLFDERLIRNQDYELNIRLRKAGGTVWFDPELSVGYRPRGSWRRSPGSTTSTATGRPS
jgi:succinoglycan biosynthesis protein ExoA